MSTDAFYDVEVPEELVSDEELQELLKFEYSEEDWSHGKPCKSHYQLRNQFVSEEAAKQTINRILTALKRIRNE